MSERYRQAGVDLDEAERAVGLFREVVGRAGSPGREIGPFAGVMALPGVAAGDLLVASADGVGTKLVLARQLGRVEGLGQDLVAMVVNDLVALGARPLFLLDYLAVERLEAEEAAMLVGAIARAASEVGAVLLGGETAELKGLLAPGELDLAGFGVGLVRPGDLVDGHTVKAGDRVLALRSSGFHANGYSLVRTLLESGIDPATPLQQGTLGEALTRPTTLYPNVVLPHLGPAVHALAPVTGGGIAGNLRRVIPAGLEARLALARLRPQEEMGLLMRRGAVAMHDALRSWNMGAGFLLVVAEEVGTGLKEAFRGEGVEAWELGRIQPGGGDVVWEA